MPLNKADLIPPLFHGQVGGGGNNERGGLGWGWGAGGALLSDISDARQDVTIKK